MNEVIKRNARRSSDQWQAVIEEQHQSNLSASAFCEQQAIGYASFCNWRRRLSTDADQPSSDEKRDTGFIDLSTLAENKSAGWNIVLKLGEGMELSLTKA